MRNMTCELAEYTAKNGKVYNYVAYQYSNDEEKIHEEFSNMEFFVISTKSKIFAEIMSKTGGFTAAMTTRLFKEENLDVSYMMLVASPQATNDFFFHFLYLDENGKVLRDLWDTNYIDYSYFKKKFVLCTVARGSIYDLLDDDRFKALKPLVSSEVSTDFDLIVEGRPVTAEDVIIFDDKNACMREYEDIITEHNIDIDHFEFKLGFGGILFMHLEGVAVTTSGETVKSYQLDKALFRAGINTVEDYVAYQKQQLKEFFGYDPGIDIQAEDYTFAISFDFAKKFSDKLSYKAKELDAGKNYPEVTGYEEEEFTR